MILLRIALVSSLLAGCAPAPAEIQVAGAASLRDVLAEAGTAFTNGPARFHFAATGVLLHQAEEGAPFDVVAFAGEEEMDRLEEAGRIEPGSRVVFATNRMVIAVPADGPHPAALSDLVDPSYRRIALGTPATVPAGRYAREGLEAAGLWSDLEPRLVFAGNVRQVVAYLERGEADAGFVYRTDLATAPEIDPAVELSATLHSPIRYAAAVVRDAANPEAARRFVRFLAGPRVEVILRRHGFEPPS